MPRSQEPQPGSCKAPSNYVDPCGAATVHFDLRLVPCPLVLPSQKQHLRPVGKDNGPTPTRSKKKKKAPQETHAWSLPLPPPPPVVVLVEMGPHPDFTRHKPRPAQKQQAQLHARRPKVSSLPPCPLAHPVSSRAISPSPISMVRRRR